MSDNLTSNPFVGLFSSPNEATSFSGVAADEKEIIIQNVFGILMTSKHIKISKQLVAVDGDTIEDAIFDRLTLPDVETKLTSAFNQKETNYDSHFIQSQVIFYLFECYSRLQSYKKDKKLKEFIINIENIIFKITATVFEAPEIFSDQEIHQQYINLFIENPTSNEIVSFTEGIVSLLLLNNNNNEDQLYTFFNPILEKLYKDIFDSNLMIFRNYWFNILLIFANYEPLAKILIRHCSPINNEGSAYSLNVLGAFLSLSCLPKTVDSPYDYFVKPSERNELMENNIWTALDALTENLFKVFDALLRCSSTIRHLTLQWLGKCLHANLQRGKIWNTQTNIGSILSVSDGFMLNLATVLLRLCQPFCEKYYINKIIKIDPTYCAVEVKNDEESLKKGIHMINMNKETCMIPIPEGETRPAADSFKFITECFYITHRALDLGYRVVLDQLMKSNRNLIMIRQHYNDAQANGNSDVYEIITEQMDTQMTKYLTLRASLLAPEMLNLLAKFHGTTAFWLMQVIIDDESEDDEKKKGFYYPNEIKLITFPLSENIPKTLMCIPELIIENTIDFICYLNRSNPNVFEEQGEKFLNPLLTIIITLMESPKRLFNPHLRAKLAEGLESLLPINDNKNIYNNIMERSLGTFHRQQLFINHPHRKQIVNNLLQVFVSIEMTGQSVQFEQKFNYRRPMYVAMNYLWNLNEQKNIFKLLAKDAELNMEAVKPPLFLRFINLLINDAVFLLDEALSNMAQLKQMLTSRDNGDWDRLPINEREQQRNNLQRIKNLARFDNILGRYTISTIKMLTSEIKSIFCHSTMVDRIASMLNYLLLQLIGPTNRNFKVKDSKEYEFNPANLVLNICQIYINLGDNYNFTLAVSQDGRSYRSDLFQLADNVLVRIGGVGILTDLENFSKRVANAANITKKEEEILNDIPDEYLDPIMSTLMKDPVILPSSNISVDRQTIARHLLSDQTDPFNRSPLTMDMVKSDDNLRNKIQEWINTKKQKEKEKQSSTSSD